MNKPLGGSNWDKNMGTVIENITNSSSEIKALVETLLLEYSMVYLVDEPGSGRISISGNYGFRDLSDEGSQIQSLLLEKYRHYFALLETLFSEQSEETLSNLSKTNKVILDTIEQKSTWCKSTQEVLKRAVDALSEQISLLNRLYDSSNCEAIYIPDTNSLIYNPKLEQWEFSETDSFALILLSSVLAELDELKINHRNETVRNKANQIIRQIKEYRRRGKLTEGVPIVGDKISIQSIAIEPNMEASLPWFDRTNRDDRILAGIIEVMRQRPRSKVTAVSRDINFQNKAEYANIAYVEPPEP